MPIKFGVRDKPVLPLLAPMAQLHNTMDAGSWARMPSLLIQSTSTHSWVAATLPQTDGMMQREQQSSSAVLTCCAQLLHAAAWLAWLGKVFSVCTSDTQRWNSSYLYLCSGGIHPHCFSSLWCVVDKIHLLCGEQASHLGNAFTSAEKKNVFLLW